MTETIRIGGLELEFLHSKEDTAGSVDVFKMTVQPNARMPVPHYHESWDETVYGLSGTLNFRVDGQDVPVGPGQTVFIQRGVVHGFSNETQAPAACLSILTPGVLGPAYFREMAVLLAETPPDPARMKETMLRYGLVPVAPKA
ncbi:MAG: cupin domain-containing protein [Rhizobiales bacterium]|jgi:quercetin dioxygenase-like cupin family protein|nr:cupin domain-containing protein [Hyphomicrobiales bacterium]